MIPRETVDKIIEAARIEEVVQDFISLKKRGVNYIGRCPFHNEKTPSFTVSPAKGIYKCFGCSAGGNAINFVMQHEHMSYVDALKYVAAKYNIPIEEVTYSPEQIAEKNERETLFVVTSFAQTQFIHNLFNTDEGISIGLSYFRERGFNTATMEKFSLGYSPESPVSLVEAAKENGYDLKYFVQTGLVKEKEGGGYFDFFRARVIFPIHNLTGKVIAFGGRTLKSDKKIPKYLNSPETEIYNKSKTLYGLFQAKRSILQQDNCFLVEGYTDVISMHQAGVENVVASAGTSLTTEQIKQIKRFTPNITILYDGDAAGIKASFRGIDMILEEGMNVKVVLFPDGDDPDSYARKVSGEDLQAYIKSAAQDFILFKSSVLHNEAQNDPVKKAELIRDIVVSISLIPDNITRSVYTKECSRMFEMDEQTLIFEINKARRKKFQKDSGATPVDPVIEEKINVAARQPKEQTDDLYYQEEEIISLLLNYGDYLIEIDVEQEDGKIEKIDVSVAEFIFHEIEVDGLAMHDKYFRLIYDEIYKHFLEEGVIVAPSHFLYQSDNKLHEIITSLISSPYELSENWAQKHRIFTHHEINKLDKKVIDMVYSYKQKSLEKIKLHLDEQLKELYSKDNFSGYDELLSEIKDYTEIRNIFAQKLGRIILK